MDRKSPKWWTVFEDNSGGFSSIRVLLFVVTFTFLINWTGAYWTAFVMDKPLPGFPTEAIALITTLGGIKMVQRYGEKPESEPPPTVTVNTFTPPPYDGGNVTTMP